MLEIWSNSLGLASEIVVVDKALLTSKSPFGDVRIPKIDMCKEAFSCGCKCCNLRKVRMLFEIYKSKVLYGRDYYQRCHAMIVSSW